MGSWGPLLRGSFTFRRKERGQETGLGLSGAVTTRDEKFRIWSQAQPGPRANMNVL